MTVYLVSENLDDTRSRVLRVSSSLEAARAFMYSQFIVRLNEEIAEAKKRGRKAPSRDWADREWFGYMVVTYFVDDGDWPRNEDYAFYTASGKRKVNF